MKVFYFESTQRLLCERTLDIEISVTTSCTTGNLSFYTQLSREVISILLLWLSVKGKENALDLEKTYTRKR